MFVRFYAKKAMPAMEQTMHALGKPGNNLSMGIVGLPNTGKSSLFNALTSSSVPAENFPFCTIEPSESRTIVPDTRFDRLCEMYKPKSIVPAHLTIIDIAGLVRGAHEGEGLGNSFLANIKNVDGIFHLCRGYEDSNVEHVEGSVDPIRDIEIIQTELRLKDASTLAKMLEAQSKDLKKMDKKRKEDYDVLCRVHAVVCNQDRDVKDQAWSASDVVYINTLQLLTAKPVIYLLNISTAEYVESNNPWLPLLKDWINSRNQADTLIAYSGSFETDLSEQEDKAAFIEDLRDEYGVKSSEIVSALPSIIETGYSAIQLIRYFTTGPDEVRAWTLRKGSKAPQAAGVIHSDFEKTFIMADVIKYADLVLLGSESAVKSSGKFYQKGKDYIVEDGDIIHFKTGKVTASKK